MDYNPKKTGGLAFPGPTFSRGGHETGHSMGMTLRDWFAGQALSIVIHRFVSDAEIDSDDIAMQAYFIADAMLAERLEEDA